MRGLGLRYLHFLAALVVGLIAALCGAIPGLLPLGMPGTDEDRIGMDLVWLGLAPGTALGILAFWLTGRRLPLGASALRTLLAGVAAVLAFDVLARVAARSAWLTLDNATLLAFVAALATLGFLPFARSAGPDAHSFRDDLPWRGRA